MNTPADAEQVSSAARSRRGRSIPAATSAVLARSFSAKLPLVCQPAPGIMNPDAVLLTNAPKRLTSGGRRRPAYDRRPAVMSSANHDAVPWRSAFAPLHTPTDLFGKRSFAEILRYYRESIRVRDVMLAATTRRTDAVVGVAPSMRRSSPPARRHHLPAGYQTDRPSQRGRAADVLRAQSAVGEGTGCSWAAADGTARYRHGDPSRLLRRRNHG